MPRKFADEPVPEGCAKQVETTADSWIGAVVAPPEMTNRGSGPSEASLPAGDLRGTEGFVALMWSRSTTTTIKDTITMENKRTSSPTKIRINTMISKTIKEITTKKTSNSSSTKNDKQPRNTTRAGIPMPTSTQSTLRTARHGA